MGAHGRSGGHEGRGQAHASRLVRKEERLKRFLIVAGTDVSSNCDVGDGPAWGSWKTVPFATHGEISIDVVRRLVEGDIYWKQGIWTALEVYPWVQAF